MMQYECRILLVDDETELLQMVGKLLVKEGYKHVDRAADCGEALRQTQEIGRASCRERVYVLV